MKKLLFFMALISVLMCLLAVAASADVIYKTESGETLFTGVDSNNDRVFESYTGAFPNTDSDGNALTWYIVSTATDGANTVHTVASFPTIDTTGTHATLSDEGVYKYVNQNKELSIVSVYFPNDRNILTLNLSDDGYGNTYDFDTDTSNLLFIRLPNTLTQFPGRLGQSTPIIDCTVDENAQYTSMGVTSFHGSKNLRSVDIPKNVTIIYSNGHVNSGYTFYNCISLVDVDFAEDSKLETIQQNAFNSCSSLKEITIPNSVVNLENNVFMYCRSLETVRLGANAGKGLAEYNVQSMLYCCDALKYVYISHTMVPTKGSHLFYSGAGKMVIFYTGTYSQYEDLKEALTTLGNNGKFTGATPIEWDKTKDDQYYKDLATTDNKNYVVYCYNRCEAFYDGIHAYDSNCTTGDACQNLCGFTATVSEHDILETIVYESFALNGIHSLICKNDGCTAINSTKSASAIFGAQGFSSNGNNGISGGFTVNTAALENYNRVNSDAPIKLGMIVVNPDYLDGKSSFFDENGNVNAEKGVLKIDVDNTDYAKISFSISGFVGEASDISLVIALYAYVDASDIELIQSQTTKCASERVTLGEESLYTVTLNSVKSANSDISKLEEYVMPGKKEQQIA